jgi:hypothetical protein
LTTQIQLNSNIRRLDVGEIKWRKKTYKAVSFFPGGGVVAAIAAASGLEDRHLH